MDTPTAMDNIISNVGKVVTAGMTWLGDAVETVCASGNELLLIFCCISFVGTGIGLMRRIIG